MRLRELMDILAGLDQDLPVMVDGYEGGISEKQLNVRIVSVLRNENDWASGLFGEHGEDYLTDTPHDLAVLISRTK